MAILNELPGIEVAICVDDQPLQEHEDEDDHEAAPGPVGAYQASKTVFKYIEAVTDKEFSIKFAVKAGYQFDCPTLGFRIMGLMEKLFFAQFC